MVIVGVGDIICADGVVIESSALYCDESSLTGEPVLVAKGADTHPFLLSGTKVGLHRNSVVDHHTDRLWMALVSSW